MFKKISILTLSLVIGAVGIFAQSTQTRSAVAGQKYKLKGVVVSKDDQGTFLVRDTVGVDTKIVISPNASITNIAFIYPLTS